MICYKYITNILYPFININVRRDNVIEGCRKKTIFFSFSFQQPVAMISTERKKNVSFDSASASQSIVENLFRDRKITTAY
jgi:hypothetical protein